MYQVQPLGSALCLPKRKKKMHASDRKQQKRAGAIIKSQTSSAPVKSLNRESHSKTTKKQRQWQIKNWQSFWNNLTPHFRIQVCVAKNRQKLLHTKARAYACLSADVFLDIISGVRQPVHLTNSIYFLTLEQPLFHSESS